MTIIRNCTTCVLVIVLFIVVTTIACFSESGESMTLKAGEKIIELSEPSRSGEMSFEETLAVRRSVRDFAGEPLTEKELSQLLWSAQGRTRSWGGRTSPSAGALYPIELYVVLPEGLFRYISRGHKLERISDRNLFRSLSEAALGQECVRRAPAVIVMTAVYERTKGKYGRRGERYVKMEIGHAAENILLQAVSLGLGAVPIGAFYDDRVSRALNLPENHEPLYLIPVGRERN